MDACSEAYVRLMAMTRESRPISTRTEAEEDHMAMVDLILELEGPEALTRYQYRWAAWGFPRC